MLCLLCVKVTIATVEVAVGMTGTREEEAVATEEDVEVVAMEVDVVVAMEVDAMVAMEVDVEAVAMEEVATAAEEEVVTAGVAMEVAAIAMEEVGDETTTEEQLGVQWISSEPCTMSHWPNCVTRFLSSVEFISSGKHSRQLQCFADFVNGISECTSLLLICLKAGLSF